MGDDVAATLQSLEALDLSTLEPGKAAEAWTMLDLQAAALAAQLARVKKSRDTFGPLSSQFLATQESRRFTLDGGHGFLQLVHRTAVPSLSRRSLLNLAASFVLTSNMAPNETEARAFAESLVDFVYANTGPGAEPVVTTSVQRRVPKPKKPRAPRVLKPFEITAANPAAVQRAEAYAASRGTKRPRADLPAAPSAGRAPATRARK